MLKRTGRSVVGALAIATAVVGTVAFAGAGTGTAATASLTLVYNCPFPLIGNQDMSVKIDVTDLPDSAVAGQPIPATKVTATATVPATATQGLTLVGATTVEGTAKANTLVDNAGAAHNVVADLVVAKTNVPASGPFDTVATGGTPPLTLANAGLTTITVGNFSTTLTPRKADGSETGLGTFTSDCTLKPGQNTQLYQFTVSPASVPTTTTAPTTTTTTLPPTTTTTTTTAPNDPLRITYGVNGSSTIKKLNSGLPLGPGTLATEVDLMAGKFEGDLALPDTSGTFKLFGFMPTTAKVRLIPQMRTHGTITAGAVTARTAVGIKLTDVRVLGIQVVRPTDWCQTVAPSIVDLTSKPGFDPLNGGGLTGSYSIGEFDRCGLVTAVVNGTIPGPGNTLDLQIAKQ
ncbi:DUF6801 domain-containing protein [Saccharothrix sp. NRRL B-16348]|uniref:DUF6801 domain-containing protein n=1 Tax=Saccharothrix sp. NRRL B-16348 TaxID=1415542 RepID=UPI0006AE462A|nr:DUF6801 domain-containing protein [Saccharothrix sp. NRRL B-16348]